MNKRPINPPAALAAKIGEANVDGNEPKERILAALALAFFFSVVALTILFPFYRASGFLHNKTLPGIEQGM